MVLALRRKVNIKVRQPLSKLLIPVISDKLRDQLDQVKEIILSEVNVKEADFIADTTGIITKKIKPNFKTLGKIYGPRMKEIAAAFATLDQHEITLIQAAESQDRPYELDLPAGKVTLNPGDYQISSEDMPGWLVGSEGSLTIALDIEVTDALKAEGVARELINRIQNIRKDSGFEVTDKVCVAIYAAPAEFAEIAASLEVFKDYLASQTLATGITIHPASEAPSDAIVTEWGETTIMIEIKKQN